MTKPLALFTIALTAIAALLSFFTSINHTIFTGINQLLPSKALWMTLTNCGDSIFLGCMLFVVLQKEKRLLFNALICALFIHYTIKYAKDFFAIARPEHTADMTHLVTLGPVLSANNFAMPSGHSASAFMAAIFIASAYKWKNWKLWAALSCAALVGISRIAVGAHWPADVCAGAAIGIVFGLLFTQKKLHLPQPFVQYLVLALYAPFIYFALCQAKHIHGTTSFINHSIFVIAGVLALCVWFMNIKRLVVEKFVMRVE